MHFNSREAVEAIKASEGAHVIGADFGGDKGISQLFKVSNGIFAVDPAFKEYAQGNGGESYAEILRKTEEFAANHNIPVGISWGAPLDGTKPLFHPKVDVFLSELKDKYSGDFKKIMPHLGIVMNDGPAGLVSGAVEAYRTFGAENVLFPINGGGLGMAVLKDGIIYSAEAGHVKAIDALNKYNQTTACGVFGAQYTCVEMLGANKAGIEVQWQARTGSYMRARDIEDRYKNGDEFAGELYDNSALIEAHLIAGVAQAFDIDLFDSKTAIVGHGGAFKFPAYGDRVVQILSKDKEDSPQFIMTKDFGNPDTNACLDGAAIAALIA